ELVQIDMSTNLTPQSISYFKNLALNIYKNSSFKIIAEGVKVQELDLCLKNKEELFFYEFKKI
ncbi:8838_t:CDS:1, partial [Gigaspora margarita]